MNEELLRSRIEVANQLISDLMDLCKVRPDYHGNGVIDDAYEYLKQVEIEEAL